MARKEHGENYSSQLAALVVSTTSPLPLRLLKCILHSARQYSVQMVLPCRSNIHNLVKIVACLVVRSGAGAAYPHLFMLRITSFGSS